MAFFDWLRDDPARSALAGAAGGVIRWVTLKERFRDGMVSILVGAICAIYLGPLALPIMQPFVGQLIIDESSRAGFSGFVVGFLGTGLATFLIDLLKAARKRVGGVETNGSDGNADGK